MGLDDFLGVSYKLSSSDNFDQYLEAMGKIFGLYWLYIFCFLGVASQIREMILESRPTIVLTKNGDTYCCKTSSTIRDNEIVFKVIFSRKFLKFLFVINSLEKKSIMWVSTDELIAQFLQSPEIKSRTKSCRTRNQ